jgi:hypothetical protein
MATRYSGNATIHVQYFGRGESSRHREEHYHTTISIGGKHVWTGDVHPPQSLTAHSPLNQGYDSPAAYDEMARSALSFYVNDMEERGDRGVGDDLDYGDEGYAVRRQKAYR